MNENKLVKKIVDYIESNLDAEISLDKMAAELNYSKFYMARTFAEETNTTIYQYIKQRRLTEAARKLVETKDSIIDIAFEAQYQSQQAFTVAFQQVYLCSPLHYRKNGVFYPKQIKMISRSGYSAKNNICMFRGKMAA